MRQTIWFVDGDIKLYNELIFQEDSYIASLRKWFSFVCNLDTPRVSGGVEVDKSVVEVVGEHYVDQVHPLDEMVPSGGHHLRSPSWTGGFRRHRPGKPMSGVPLLLPLQDAVQPVPESLLRLVTSFRLALLFLLFLPRLLLPAYTKGDFVRTLSNKRTIFSDRLTTMFSKYGYFLTFCF